MRPRVLLLSSYPIKIPLHGGQIRTKNIAMAYEAAGAKVLGISIFNSNSYREYGDSDIPFDVSRFPDQFKNPLMEDYWIGRLAGECHDIFNIVFDRFVGFGVEIIHVEQPWLWRLAKKIQELANVRVPIVFGTQNIEYELKGKMFISAGIDDADSIDLVFRLEQDAIRKSDLVLAVTESDSVFIRNLNDNCEIVRNAISPWASSSLRLGFWRKFLPVEPWALYVASAHPPNYDGFSELIGDCLGFLPPRSKVVIAGGASAVIEGRLVKESRWGALNQGRLVCLGVLGDADLSAVKSLAHCFLLPIKDGGGSNIKTAEALYSLKHVVGTSASFRGYEKYVSLPRVSIADNRDNFRVAVRRTLLTQPVGVPDLPPEELTWRVALKSLPQLVFQKWGTQ